MMYLHRWSIVLLLVLFSACGTQDPATQAETELQTLQSWVATAHMVGDAWLQGDVPAAYAKQTLQTAEQEIGSTLDEIPAQSTDAGMREQAQRAKESVTQMAQAAQQGDRDALARALQQLAQDEHALSGLQQTMGQHQ